VRAGVRTALASLAAAIVAAGAGGCGLGPGAGTSQVNLTVTKGFGSAKLASVTATKVPGSETVMRMLERSLHVQTRYGGGYVQSIDGLSGNSAHHDWFYYVNGIEAPLGAAVTAVHHGDRIWWDLHDWRATASIPAVVGSFPEPFLHGIGGKRLPTALECASNVRVACRRIASTLGALGVPVATQFLGTGSGTDSLAVDVGTWRELQSELVAALIERGPSLSGIYARFSGRGGGELQLLNPRGQVVKTLGPGAGLVAATAQNGSVPTWLITGTDAQGVAAAAQALSAGHLRNRFALAVQGSHDFALPLNGSS
jgi:Domain of unknown function (DUF4430)